MPGRSARRSRRRASTRVPTSIHTIIVAKPTRAGSSRAPARPSSCGTRRWSTAGLSDIYGACAAMCEAKDGLHIVEDQILVETVDPVTGSARPSSDGRAGVHHAHEEKLVLIRPYR